MKTAKTKQIFKIWLNKNINKFRYKLIYEKEGVYYFKGLDKNIKLCLSFKSAEVMICFYYKNELFDMRVIEYIGILKHNEKGFFDDDRTPKTYYKNYKKFIINEVFNHILEFVNKNFKLKTKIYFYQFKGVRFVKIGKKGRDKVKLKFVLI